MSAQRIPPSAIYQSWNRNCLMIVVYMYAICNFVRSSALQYQYMGNYAQKMQLWFSAEHGPSSPIATCQPSRKRGENKWETLLANGANQFTLSTKRHERKVLESSIESYISFIWNSIFRWCQLIVDRAMIHEHHYETIFRLSPIAIPLCFVMLSGCS